MDFSFTAYFESKVLAKRPYITREMCIRVVQDPVRIELQTDCERVRFWAQVPENHPQCVPGSEIQAMRIEYFPDTDSLYIDLADRAGVDTREIGDGIVVDVDADGHPVGIDIDQASKHLDLRTLDLRRIPFGVEKLAG
jgi:uncharacterized protein YuzE